MTTPPKYSVIVPLFNKEPYVLRALASILKQTQPDFEVVVVDDGSTDGSALLVSKVVDGRVRLVQQANAGVSAARNRGIREARAPFIAFLDADDEWLPDFLATIDQLIDHYPDAGAYATACWFIKETGELRFAGNRKALGGRREGMVTNYFRGGNILWACTAVVRADVLARVGGFNERMSSSEDQQLWLRIASQSSFAYTNAAKTLYHVGVPGSLSKNQSPSGIDEMLKTCDTLLLAGLQSGRAVGIRLFLQISLRNAILASVSAHDLDHSRRLAELYASRYPASRWNGLLRRMIACPGLCRLYLSRKRLVGGWSYLRYTYLFPPVWNRSKGSRKAVSL